MYNLTLGFPPSVNTCYTVHRGRKIITAKARDYKYEVSELLGNNRQPLKGAVKCTYRFYRGDRRQYDISNYIKVVEDCLTDAKIWVDDSQVVEIHMYKMAVDKENPRVEIRIEELV